MANTNENPEVKVEEPIIPAEETPTEDTVVPQENVTPPESSNGNNGQAETPEVEEPEGEEPPETTPPTEPKSVPGETPREYALRKEIERIKGENRRLKGEDLFKEPAPQPQTPTQTPEAEDPILSQLDPEELARFRQVLKAVAKSEGFVQKTELQTETYATQAQSQLDSFWEEHPEYLPENDKDGLLWGQFREQYQLYKQPENPKDFKRLFNKIHGDILGTSGGDIKKINAQIAKVKVASHSGASGSGNPPVAKKQIDSSLRADMLIGMSDEEKADLLS